MLRRIALTASVVLTVTAAFAGQAGGGHSPIRPLSVALNPLAAMPGRLCADIDQAMGMIEAVGGRNFQFLHGGTAARAAALYNETPPVSRDDWSLVALVDGPDGTGSLLVGNGVEVCGRVNFTAELWPRLVERLLGRRV